ncbi:hypothetical protein QYE76_031169 [Lolium multiflorum]|uniref:Uncharacterized protein n=1 Tax=Lolium multiflorum TaxID=4521 RepID=A0AAD8QSN3_LOLMU|nr:hypothetical protein QYE76_031169 [Lolium multiflorum]
MAAEDLEWERSKISNQDLNMLKRLGLMKKEDAIRFPSEESYPNPPMEYRVSFVDHLIRGLSAPIHDFLRGLLFVYGIQLHQIRVQPLQARKNPLWTYAGENDANRLSNDLSAKDLEKLIRRISRLNKKDPVPSSCRVEPYSSANPLPENHPTMASLPPLPEDGEVEEQAIVAEDNQGSSLPESEVAGSHKSAASHEKEVESEASESTQSLPPAVSPKNKRKRNDAEDSGTSKPEEAVPSRQKAAYDPYLETLISSDEEEEVPNVDVAARTSTSHTLVASETPVEGEENSPPQQNVGTATPPSSPLVPSPKRARVETIPEPTLQSSSSSNPLLDDPMIKDLIRIGSQFIGYREYANRTEEKLAEANKRVGALVQKLEQSEAARKKAELAASEAKAEADEARAKVASVEELQKRLEDAESALNEHKTAQAAREQGILKRLKSQIRRTETQTNQGFDLENPVNDPLLDTLSYLELHGSEIREGVANASAGLSTLFPYFFPKKEEPPTFLALAKSFNSSEDLGLKMRQENMKIAVESTVALVADSQQTVDWMKVGDTDQIEQSSKDLTEELKELRVQLQSVKKQSLMLMEQSRESSEREKIALQQARDAMTEKDAAVAEVAAAISRENAMLQLLTDASLDIAGIWLGNPCLLVFDSVCSSFDYLCDDVGSKPW